MLDSGGLHNTNRCHWSDEFQKRDIFFGKSCSRDFGTLGCHPSFLIDLANTALASRCTVKTICMTLEGYGTNRGVTGPMNFKKPGRFFSENRAPGNLGPLAAIQTLELTLQTLL